MTLVERSWVTVEVCVLTQKDWIFSLLGIDWYTILLLEDQYKLKLFKIWMISWRPIKIFYFNQIIKQKRSMISYQNSGKIETNNRWTTVFFFHNNFLFYGYKLFFSKLFWLVDLFSCSNSSWLSHLKFIEIKEVF